MKSAALRREIWRDITTGTSWTLIFTLIASVCITGIAMTDILVVSQLTSKAQQYRHSMASVMVLEAPKSIDGKACMALARVAGVHSAAAVRSPEHQVSANAIPSSSIRTFEATTGIGALLRAHTATDTSRGIYLSEQVATALSAQPGAHRVFDNQDTFIAGVFPWPENDGRKPGYAYSMFIPTPPQGTFDECWIDTWPMNPALDALLRGTLIPKGNQADVAPTKLYAFNQSLGSSFDGTGLLRERLGAHAIWIITAVGIVIGAASVWRRRLEIASDLHAGVTRVDLLTKFAWETAVWVSSTLILALPILSWVILRNPTNDQHAMWALASMHLTVGALSCMIGALIAGLSVREKYLLTFFKHR